MADLLKFESDMQTIQIISNSLSFQGLVDARNKEGERNKYVSKIGYLYPERSDMLNSATDYKGILTALEDTPYHSMLKQVTRVEGDRHEAESSEVTIDEVMLQESSRRFSLSFEGGFHYGVFYAFLKLRDQEIRNVTWLADLVSLQVGRALPGWNKYVVPFKYHLDEYKPAGDKQ